ncbi:Oxidoreductase htatip2 [Coemansia biformis]|uniref:Oxidoreductase htatip2 n=1 Tax=Coemansia biformis TaxID=1286918 RepID=A0A9W7Y8I8_9FUNG|nr:Oxidoreductase htatip2 [Coemansia biformis]
MASPVTIDAETPVLGEGFTSAASAFKERSPGRCALVMGGTGQVGREVVKHLLASDAFAKVTVLTRRPIEYAGANAEKLEQKSVDYENTEQLERDTAGHTHAFFCLGTTRAKSGSDGFYKVDHDYALNAARACKAAGVEHYSVCSSSGASKDSRFLYTRAKGEVDAEVQSMGFPRASIFRPAMLMCHRDEARLLERVAGFVMPAINYVLPNKASIPTSTVAWAMVSNAFKAVDTPVSETVSNAQMLQAFRDGQ